MTLQFARTLSIFALAFAPVIAAQAAPKKEAAANKPIVVEGDLKPFGNPNAPQGGTFTWNIGGEPPTIHPITSGDLYSRYVKDLVLDQLMVVNPETFEYIPGLADRLEISANGMEYTFHLRPGVKFSDGKPLTAEDVKFSFDAIFEPKYNAAHLIPYYENIAKAEVIDPQTVKFTAKEKYFGNLEQLATLYVIPKHVYSDAEASKKMNKTLVGSGPYRIEKYDQGQSIVIVRNKDWWGNSVSHLKGKFNFERIRMRFIKEDNTGLEMLKKGELDFEGFTPEVYEKKAVGAEWGKTVMKTKVENSAPKSFGFIGWNLRRPMFQDKNVRIALAMLMDRASMIEKFRFGYSLPATGPEHQQSENADPSVKAIKFDPKGAVELLKKAGWVDSDKDGVLDKMIDGKKTDLRMTLLNPSKDVEKYFILYQNDLKKAGVDLQLNLIEWNAFTKAIDEANFDCIAMAWGASSPDWDPKQIWHSASIAKGGSNYIAYKNPEVDKLIDQARIELDKKKRTTQLRKIYKMIADDAPYAFLFNDRYTFYGHTPRVKMSKPTFKYATGWQYWWFDPAK